MQGSAVCAGFLILNLFTLSQSDGAVNKPKIPGSDFDVVENPEFPGTILVEFCHSWGYGNQFQLLKRRLLAHNPDLKVQGKHYPIDPFKLKIAQVAQYAFFAAIFMMFVGDKVFSTFGIPEPELYVTMKKNKMQTLFAFFFDQ